MIRHFRLGVVLSVVLAMCVADALGFTLLNYMNIDYATKPSFHPGGNEFAYISNLTGVPQVWRIQALTGYQYQVTFDTNGVDGVWWSPFNPAIMVISAAVGGNERSQLYLINPAGGEWSRLTSDDDAIYSFGCWSPDGSRFSYATNARDKVNFDVYEFSLESGKQMLLYQGEGINSAAAYSPDNRLLLITNTISSLNGNILVYDRESGKTRCLTQHEEEIEYAHPRWNRDATGFYFLTDMSREFLGLAYWPLDSSGFRWIETPNWDVEDFAVSKDEAYLAWSVNEDGYSRLHVRNLRRKTETPASRFPPGIARNLTFCNDGSKLIYSFAAGDRSYDIWVYETYADKLHQATFSPSGGIPRENFVTPTLIHFQSFDSLQIPALWYRPVAASGRLPVIVAIHGGPESQARPNMSALYQYFISRGFAILEPNVRGSSGYGRSFMTLDDVGNRMNSVRDIEYAARWLKERSDVDPKRLVAFGESYGGFMALASLANYSDTWAAGVSIVGIANFVTFLENTGPYRRALREAEYGNLKTDRQLLTDISPVNHADQIKAPLFLIQGSNDPRVPKSEADQIADAIRSHGGIVEYMLFADEGHGLRKTKNRIAAYGTLDEFLSKYVLKK